MWGEWAEGGVASRELVKPSGGHMNSSLLQTKHVHWFLLISLRKYIAGICRVCPSDSISLQDSTWLMYGVVRWRICLVQCSTVEFFQSTWETLVRNMPTIPDLCVDWLVCCFYCGGKKEDAIFRWQHCHRMLTCWELLCKLCEGGRLPSAN